MTAEQAAAKALEQEYAHLRFRLALARYHQAHTGAQARDRRTVRRSS